MGAILSSLLGGGISAITGDLRRAYEAKLNAQNNEDRVKAEVEISHLEARRDLLLAEQANWMTRWIRPALATPVVLLIWKLFVYDKMLGWGTTDELSPWMYGYLMLVTTSYFLGRSYEKARR